MHTIIVTLLIVIVVCFPFQYIAHEVHVNLKTVTLELIGEKE